MTWLDVLAGASVLGLLLFVLAIYASLRAASKADDYWEEQR